MGSGFFVALASATPSEDLGPVLPFIANYTISNGDLYLQETGSNTATVDVTLSRNPGGNKTVSLTSDNSRFTTNVNSLDFTTGNWDTPQQVIITGQSSSGQGVKYDNLNAELEGETVSQEVKTADSTIDASLLTQDPLTGMMHGSLAELLQMQSDTLDWIYGTGYGNGDAVITSAIPTGIVTHVNDQYVDGSGFTNLLEIKRGFHQIDPAKNWGFYFYHFKPASNIQNKVLLLPTGHGDLWSVIITPTQGNHDYPIQRCLTAGIDVVVWYSAGRGPNPTDDGITQGTGGVGGTHDQMASLESSNPYFNPFKYFLEATCVAVNWVNNAGSIGKNFVNLGNLPILGVSGGGWAVMWAAFENRINQFFNVNGNYPFFIRMVQCNSGDYEQGFFDPCDPPNRTTATVGEQYARVSPLDMYSMSAQGGKKHIQFNNINDSCCYEGTYNTIYKEELKKLGYDFDAILYDAPGEHTINQDVMDVVIPLI